MSSSHAFDPSKHPRNHGRFAGSNGAPSFSVKPISEPSPGRSKTPGEGWQRIGTKIAAIPRSYTGSSLRNSQPAQFLSQKLVHQIPKSMETKAHFELLKSLTGIIKSNEAGAIAKATQHGLIPYGTDPHTVHRAYNHASMFALHKFGVVDYDFHMDNELKEEMKPLRRFMIYAKRRVQDRMLATHKGAWRPYRQEFGKPFPTPKFDRTTGEQRLRMRPNEEMIKAAPLQPGVLPPQQGVSRWDRFRAYIARDEHMGLHDENPLTQAQRMERKRAALAERQKLRSHAITLQQGMPGSLKGMSIGHRDYGSYAARSQAASQRPVGLSGSMGAPGGVKEPKIPGLSPALGKRDNDLRVADNIRSSGLFKRHIPGMHPDAYMLLPDSHKAEFSDGDTVSLDQQDTAHLLPHVAAVMPIARAVLASYKGHGATSEKSRKARHARSAMIADHRVPLSHAVR